MDVGIALEKSTGGANGSLIPHIFHMLNCDWEVSFAHVSREVNSVTDDLAKLDGKGTAGGQIFYIPPAPIIGLPPAVERHLLLDAPSLLQRDETRLVVSTGDPPHEINFGISYCYDPRTAHT
ncbi:hypothetical protein V6N13_058676 [Hibiscus sabdariffa]|uniref:RNase H type-1 domain-containing protein n=1 Tax=Hibiscus sabdariffa TaxID=183260 RepID=A0ABR2GFH1_9ROSI